MPQWQNLFSALREHDISVSVRDMPRPVGGGDISSAWRVRTDRQPVFLKTGPASALDMFLAEADGLRELAGAKAMRVPTVLGCTPSNGSISNRQRKAPSGGWAAISRNCIVLLRTDSAGIATTRSGLRYSEIRGAMTGSRSLVYTDWHSSSNWLRRMASMASCKRWEIAC